MSSKDKATIPMSSTDDITVESSFSSGKDEVVDAIELKSHIQSLTHAIELKNPEAAIFLHGGAEEYYKGVPIKYVRNVGLKLFDFPNNELIVDLLKENKAEVIKMTKTLQVKNEAATKAKGGDIFDTVMVVQKVIQTIPHNQRGPDLETLSLSLAKSQVK